MFLARVFLFLFNATSTTDLYTLSLHDALPICDRGRAAMHHFPGFDQGNSPREGCRSSATSSCWPRPTGLRRSSPRPARSEEHTSELQSHSDLVCRLLLEKKKKNKNNKQLNTLD